MYLITTQQNDYPLSGLVSKGRVWHKSLNHAEKCIW